MVLDKQAVVTASVSGYDITKDVIDRLDAKMPTFKVNLNAAAAAAMAQRPQQ